jgi:hypothetical protein
MKEIMKKWKCKTPGCDYSCTQEKSPEVCPDCERLEFEEIIETKKVKIEKDESSKTNKQPKENNKPFIIILIVCGLALSFLIGSLSVTIPGRKSLKSLEKGALELKEKVSYLTIANTLLKNGVTRMIPNSAIEKMIANWKADKNESFSCLSSENENFFGLEISKEIQKKHFKEGNSHNIYVFLNEWSSNPKNLKILWKAKKNVIIAAIKKRGDSPAIVDAIKITIKKTKASKRLRTQYVEMFKELKKEIG